MTLEKEFGKHYDRFHFYAEKSKLLFDLYVDKKRVIMSWIEAVPECKDCFVKLLDVKNKKILNVFENWKTPEKTLKNIKEIYKKRIGSHLIADVTYVFWKQAYLAKVLKNKLDSLTNKALLEQAIVTMCSAYECYLKELVPWVLKNDENSAKRFLGQLDLPTKALGKYRFEPLKHVHKIYFETNRNKQLPVFDEMLTQYKNHFNISLFFSKQEEDYVRKIFQVRNCVVHNQSKPDAKWYALTNGEKFVIDKNLTWEYMIKLHEKMHDVSSQIFKYLNLEKKHAPWIVTKKPSETGMRFNGKRWKYFNGQKRKKGIKTKTY